jgi:hypothetical protein
MMKLLATVLAGAFIAFSALVPACLAEEKAAAPQAQPAPAAEAVPPVLDQAAPAMKSRSFRKAAPSPAPEAPSKGGLASPDDTIGGLPGAKQATSDKQP